MLQKLLELRERIFEWPRRNRVELNAVLDNEKKFGFSISVNLYGA